IVVPGRELDLRRRILAGQGDSGPGLLHQAEQDRTRWIDRTPEDRPADRRARGQILKGLFSSGRPGSAARNHLWRHIFIMFSLDFKQVRGAAFAVGAAVFALTGLSTGARAQNLTGAGATFPAPLYQKWFQEFAQDGGVPVNYQAIGSGGGIKAITGHTVDF